METATALRSCVGAAPYSFPRPGILVSSRPGFTRSSTKSSIKQHPLNSSSKSLHQRFSVRSRKCTAIRASLSSDSFRPSSPVAPLKLESPIGQFLSQILISHPHLVPAAVEQQLEQLQTDRDAQKQKEDPSASGSDLVLYRRIAEVKASERKKALEEILYALVVHKFINANVSLIPAISPSSSESSGKVDTWPHQDENLEQLHSSEAYEMIQNHLAFILGNRLGDSSSLAQISKLKVGQVYAASVMYGYFLKRVDQRFQLEKSMKILPQGNGDEERNNNIGQVIGDDETRPSANNVNNPFGNATQHPKVGTGGFGFGQGIKSSRLKTYVMSFDADSLQRYATIRSQEAISVIEKHTEALFGRPEIIITPHGTIDSSRVENITISFGGLRRLVLEAVTFGSFLWDVESHVDSRYHFVTN